MSDAKQSEMERREALNHMMIQLAEQGAGESAVKDGKYVYELDPSQIQTDDLDPSVQEALKGILGSPDRQAKAIHGYLEAAQAAVENHIEKRDDLSQEEKQQLKEEYAVSVTVNEEKGRIRFQWNPKYADEIAGILVNADKSSEQDPSKDFSGIVAIMTRTETEMAERNKPRKHDAVARAGDILGRGGVAVASMDDDSPEAPGNLTSQARERQRSVEHSA